MVIFRWLGWVLAAAIGLLASASGLENLFLIATGKIAPHPELACSVMWTLWVASWIAAMAWSRRTSVRALPAQEIAYLLLPAIGFYLLARGSIATHFRPLWLIPDSIGWFVAALCGVGLAFTWWARLSLGPLWSLSVNRKDAHRIVQDGAYGLVRHPIYTGLITAAVTHAALIGQAENLTGALLITIGFWLKARFEERFLARELGTTAYAEYARRTPMLVPLWSIRG